MNLEISLSENIEIKHDFQKMHNDHCTIDSFSLVSYNKSFDLSGFNHSTQGFSIIPFKHTGVEIDYLTLQENHRILQDKYKILIENTKGKLNLEREKGKTHLNQITILNEEITKLNAINEEIMNSKNKLQAQLEESLKEKITISDKNKSLKEELDNKIERIDIYDKAEQELLENKAMLLKLISDNNIDKVSLSVRLESLENENHRLNCYSINLEESLNISNNKINSFLTEYKEKENNLKMVMEKIKSETSTKQMAVNEKEKEMILTLDVYEKKFATLNDINNKRVEIINFLHETLDKVKSDYSELRDKFIKCQELLMLSGKNNNLLTKTSCFKFNLLKDKNEDELDILNYLLSTLKSDIQSQSLCNKDKIFQAISVINQISEAYSRYYNKYNSIKSENDKLKITLNSKNNELDNYRNLPEKMNLISTKLENSINQNQISNLKLENLSNDNTTLNNLCIILRQQVKELLFTLKTQYGYTISENKYYETLQTSYKNTNHLNSEFKTFIFNNIENLENNYFNLMKYKLEKEKIPSDNSENTQNKLYKIDIDFLKSIEELNIKQSRIDDLEKQLLNTNKKLEESDKLIKDQQYRLGNYENENKYTQNTIEIQTKLIKHEMEAALLKSKEIESLNSDLKKIIEEKDLKIVSLKDSSNKISSELSILQSQHSLINNQFNTLKSNLTLIEEEKKIIEDKFILYKEFYKLQNERMENNYNDVLISQHNKASLIESAILFLGCCLEKLKLKLNYNQDNIYDNIILTEYLSFNEDELKNQETFKNNPEYNFIYNKINEVIFSLKKLEESKSKNKLKRKRKEIQMKEISFLGQKHSKVVETPSIKVNNANILRKNYNKKLKSVNSLYKEKCDILDKILTQTSNKDLVLNENNENECLSNNLLSAKISSSRIKELIESNNQLNANYVNARSSVFELEMENKIISIRNSLLAESKSKYQLKFDNYITSIKQKDSQIKRLVQEISSKKEQLEGIQKDNLKLKSELILNKNSFTQVNNNANANKVITSNAINSTNKTDNCSQNELKNQITELEKKLKTSDDTYKFNLKRFFVYCDKIRRVFEVQKRNEEFALKQAQDYKDKIEYIGKENSVLISKSQELENNYSSTNKDYNILKNKYQDLHEELKKFEEMKKDYLDISHLSAPSDFKQAFIKLKNGMIRAQQIINSQEEIINQIKTENTQIKLKLENIKNNPSSNEEIEKIKATLATKLKENCLLRDSIDYLTESLSMWFDEKKEEDYNKLDIEADIDELKNKRFFIKLGNPITSENKEKILEDVTKNSDKTENSIIDLLNDSLEYQKENSINKFLKNSEALESLSSLSKENMEKVYQLLITKMVNLLNKSRSFIALLKDNKISN